MKLSSYFNIKGNSVVSIPFCVDHKEFNMNTEDASSALIQEMAKSKLSSGDHMLNPQILSTAEISKGGG